jgi:hypothetical protein
MGWNDQCVMQLQYHYIMTHNKTSWHPFIVCKGSFCVVDGEVHLYLVTLVSLFFLCFVISCHNYNKYSLFKCLSNRWSLDFECIKLRWLELKFLLKLFEIYVIFLCKIEFDNNVVILVRSHSKCIAIDHWQQ